MSHSASKSFPMTLYTPKSELKRRSDGPDNLDKENYGNRENYVVTKFFVSQRKLCRDQVFCCNKANSVATKFFVAMKKLCRNRENSVVTKTLEKSKKA